MEEQIVDVAEKEVVLENVDIEIAGAPKMELTEKEQETLKSYISQIDITDTQMVLQYGAGAQKKIADFSESALNSVRTKDLGEVGDMLTDVVTELKGFDVQESKGFFGFFKT